MDDIAQLNRLKDHKPLPLYHRIFLHLTMCLHSIINYININLNLKKRKSTKVSLLIHLKLTTRLLFLTFILNSLNILLQITQNFKMQKIVNFYEIRINLILIHLLLVECFLIFLYQLESLKLFIECFLNYYLDDPLFFSYFQ